MKSFDRWLLLRENQEDRGMIQTLRANPKDMVTWAVYADWLEEHGDPMAPLVRGLVLGRRTLANIRRLDSLWQSASAELKRLISLAVPVAYYALNLGGRRTTLSLTNAAEIVRRTREASTPVTVSHIMDDINTMMKGFGVEAIRGDRTPNSYYWQDTAALYVNMGDTYDLTVLYNVPRGRFEFTSYGDWVERNMNRYGIH